MTARREPPTAGGAPAPAAYAPPGADARGDDAAYAPPDTGIAPAVPAPLRVELSRLAAVVREDVRHNRRSWTSPGAQALAAYRLGHWAEARHAHFLLARLLRPVCRLLRHHVRRHFGIDLSPHARIGRGVSIFHQGGIVVDGSAAIGDRCVIRQQVRIGSFSAPVAPGGRGPRIGNGVDFSARSVIDGPVDVGDEARIGANAVVTSDVPAACTVMAPPSRTVRAPADPAIEAAPPAS